MRKSLIREVFKNFKIVYSFEATVANGDYHVYKNTTWNHAKVGDKVLVEIESNKKSKEIDSYCCSIRASVNQQIKKLDTSLEKFRQVYFFLKDEHSHIDRAVKSIDYRQSPIPAGELQIPLTMNFKCPWYITYIKMKEFVSTLYSFDYNGNKEGERDILINELSEESQR